MNPSYLRLNITPKPIIELNRFPLSFYNTNLVCYYYLCEMPTVVKRDIRKLTLEDIQKFFVENGDKAFRAKQVYEWLWKKSARTFDHMTNLSLATRDLLKEHFEIKAVSIADAQFSNDKTIKYAMGLADGNEVESVLIPATDRITACVSSQVGCSLTCSFCATGYMDRKRNLDPAEIYDQVVHVSEQAQEHFARPLTNIVYMGMGEPLLNYKNMMESIERITSDKGLNMSPRRITVSTAGIAKMITKLADDEVKFRLALSLHAANDEKRNKIMPINETNTLDVLSEALCYFYEKTGNRITLEYIVFHNFNDELEDAEELFQFAKQFPCRINIIEYNPIENADFKNADKDAIDKFATYLERKKMNVNVRRSRGKDIDAACGQLAGKRK